MLQHKPPMALQTRASHTKRLSDRESNHGLLLCSATSQLRAMSTASVAELHDAALSGTFA